MAGKSSTEYVDAVQDSSLNRPTSSQSDSEKTPLYFSIMSVAIYARLERELKQTNTVMLSDDRK